MVKMCGIVGTCGAELWYDVWFYPLPDIAYNLLNCLPL